jgi:hypothetical protein
MNAGIISNRVPIFVQPAVANTFKGITMVF